ncbi:MAG TPA: PadR family transcriptional regulator [Acidimicrobiales bacterium]|nr:PadR family transcriptional regulator [Acidimicrobiales bacterium]
MLEFAILGLLKEHSMHGYDLRRHLRDDFGVLANLSFGSLYPALSRLEASGAIRSVGSGNLTAIDVESPALLTGSLGGERAATMARRATAKVAETLGRSGTRARKVYEITPAGELLFEQLLESPSTGKGDLRGFSLRLAFARYLSPQARIRLLERRRIELSDHLRRSSTHLDRPTRSLDTYERSLAEHAREAVVNDLAWIERLIEREHVLSEISTDEHRGNEMASESSTTISHANNKSAVTAHAADGAKFSHDGGITA